VEKTAMLSPATKSLEVHKIAGALGAEISGVDLAHDLDADTVAAIRQIWLDNLVVFFRNQDLPPARFLAAAKRFGEPIEYPFLKGLDGFPEIITVAKLEREKVNFGGVWHSDTSYLETPPMATMLIAREVPPIGGDTMFANQYLAYETLSEGMQRLLDALSPSTLRPRRTPRAPARTAAACATATRRRRARTTWPSIPWCAPIRRPAARRSTSISPTPRASRS
jgi:alpha-ketoglutarate-dependent taurine dioxygenase